MGMRDVFRLDEVGRYHLPIFVPTKMAAEIRDWSQRHPTASKNPRAVNPGGRPSVGAAMRFLVFRGLELAAARGIKCPKGDRQGGPQRPTPGGFLQLSLNLTGSEWDEVDDWVNAGSGNRNFGVSFLIQLALDEDPSSSSSPPPPP